MVSRTKPIHIICDSGVSQNQLSAVVDGIKELLQIAGVQDLVQVRNFGVWKHKNSMDGNRLVPYYSVGWYVQNAITGRQNEVGEYQLHSGIILGSFCHEPWQEYEPHYDVMVTSWDLYERNYNWLLGSALPLTGTVLSTWRWKNLSDCDQYKLLKTEAMHEMGHVFGLPDRNRKNLQQSLGGHCRNRCIMRQGLRLVQWEAYTEDRISYGALCPECRRDLYNFFRQRP